MPLAHAADGRRISFAQNGEDIVLLRVFGHRPTGRWIDVGANHPINDSVTKNFSDLGWCGLNVEPVESFHRELVSHRPHDVNALAAVSDSTGVATFYRNDSNLDLSTFDESLVEVYRARGDTIIPVDVPVIRLAELCRQHLPPGPVDFLKVDTEGHELAVLSSHDFDAYPPQVVLAEATDARLEGLIQLLEERGMRFVTFDGLNSWFVAAAHWSALALPIARPPSPVLDWYHPAYYVTAMTDRDAEIARLRAELARQDPIYRARRAAGAVVRRTRAALRPLRKRPGVSEPACGAS
jgi:FkbM family methyltransferase